MELSSNFWLLSATVFAVLAALNTAVAGNVALRAGFLIVALAHACRGIWEYTV